MAVVHPVDPVGAQHREELAIGRDDSCGRIDTECRNGHVIVEVLVLLRCGLDVHALRGSVDGAADDTQHRGHGRGPGIQAIVDAAREQQRFECVRVLGEHQHGARRHPPRECPHTTVFGGRARLVEQQRDAVRAAQPVRLCQRETGIDRGQAAPSRVLERLPQCIRRAIPRRIDCENDL